MNVHEWHRNVQKSYEDQLYMHHLVLLHEWNECVSFLPTLTTITMGQLGVAVYQEIQQREAKFDFEKDEFVDLSKDCEYFQLLAIYGDDDDLRRFTIFNNGKPSNPEYPLFADEHCNTELMSKIIRQ
jgi:hypothetical protein